jgi:nickel/cobalt transporter (NicO) family protein
MASMRLLLLPLLALLALAVPALAHPHVFVDVNGELIFDDAGRIKAVGNVWRFDDAFSAFATEGLDADGDGQLSDQELQPLAKINVESLADFEYFTWLTIDGVKQKFMPPTEYWLQFDGQLLTLFYTLQLDIPVLPGKDTTLEIFDPEYFVAFNFPGEQPLTLSGAPEGCTATYHPPQGLDDQTMAALNALPYDQRELPPDLQAAADSLADAFSIDCPVTEVAAAPTAPEPSRPTGKSPFGIATPDGSSAMTVGGPFGPVFAWIAARQSEFYRSLTSTLSSIKENGAAVWLLLLVAFLYGIFHAAGPGHGKAVITSYVLASGETVRRGVVISFAAAMVQAVTAIVIVLAATVVIGATAAQITGVTDWLEIGSYGAIVLVGLWLVWSKVFGSGHHHHHHGPLPAAGHDHQGHHHHDHDHGHGHIHPRHDEDGEVRVAHDLDELAAARKVQPMVTAPATPARRAPPPVAPKGGNWLMRAWSAILAVGIRPCSGAIIILVFALSQGLLLAGIAATFVMALGTGITVAALATIAVSARGLAARFADTGGGHSHGGMVLRAVEIGGALAVLLFGILLLGGALYPML